MTVPDQYVASLLPKLRSGRVRYFPIRHHSPACAGHLGRWIDAHRPAAVLVEGPASFTSKIDLLTDERCVCPVALYTTFVDKCGRVTGDTPFGPPRFAAYYPFCDYSPELVALRAGRATGAKLRFIDLEYPEMIVARHADPAADMEGIRVDSLADDSHLRHSQYLRVLARRLGCRDFNELWDHLFESAAESLPTDVFIDRVAAYCAMARLDYTADALQNDGTMAREACMAWHIREALKDDGPVLVVTGGFHTVALPDLVAGGTERPAPVQVGDDEAGNWLMRYSFDQLDALAGYASGMPSPAFYDQLWHAVGGPEQVAADVIVEIGRLTRERGFPAAITTPDAIAAVQMARQLAAMRGHPWPLREDVLDGISSCFIKGEVGVEGQLLLRLVHEVLAGNRVGQTPPGSGVPPLVDDFHAQARRLRLPVDAVQRRDMTLDLYRSSAHREVSRLLHRLNLLEAPFASFQGGPDFVTGHGLDLMQERWQVCWSPATDSALIEASIFGPTVEEAAGAKLRQKIAHLADEGAGRNTAAAVALLIRACRLGLHEQAASLVPLIDTHIVEDPALPSVVNGLSQLELLGRSREPLEAGQLTAVPRLMNAAYQRACRLLDGVETCPDDVVELVLEALRTLREVLAANLSGASPGLDADLFHAGLRRIVVGPPSAVQAAVVGAAAGILHGEGRLSEAELIQVVLGFLGRTAAEAKRSCGVLRGLLATAREIAWQVGEVLRAVDRQFAAWDEATFLQALPELRLAFADLTPREIAQVADCVATLHGASTLGELVHTDLDENEVQFALAVTQRVRATLRADGLS
jgi:hypothetical protein